MSTNAEILSEILSRLDVPEMRRDISNTNNLAWLERNLLIRNNNTDGRNAMAIVREMRSNAV